MSSKSTRSFEERNSSYKRNFGAPRTFSPARNRAASSSSKTYRMTSSSSSAGGAMRSPGWKAGYGVARGGGEFITATRATPVACAVSMSDINHMADAMGSDFQRMRVNEKEEMRALNSRLAGYITKVRALEEENQILEAQLEHYKGLKPSRVGEMYEDELARLRQSIDGLEREKAKLEMQLDNAYTEINKLTKKVEEEASLRREVEEDLAEARKDCDEASLARFDLERRIEALQEEIDFLNQVHEKEISELHERLRTTEIKIDTTPGPDLEELLEEMRANYERMTVKNQANAEKIFTEKVVGLEDAAVRNEDQLRNIRTELSDCRKEMQATTFEVDSLRGTNDALRRGMKDLEDRYARDTSDYQETILTMQNECDDLKNQMADHLRQYQELMRVKMALDMEIATYRKLLDGEEQRLTKTSKVSAAATAARVERSSAMASEGAVSKGYSSTLAQGLVRASDVDDLETITKKQVTVTTIEKKDGVLVSKTEETYDTDVKTPH